MRSIRSLAIAVAAASAVALAPLAGNAGLTDPTIVGQALNTAGDRIGIAAYNTLPAEGGIAQVRRSTASTVTEVALECVKVRSEGGRMIGFMRGKAKDDATYYITVMDGGLSNPSNIVDRLVISTTGNGPAETCGIVAPTSQTLIDNTSARVTSGDITVTP